MNFLRKYNVATAAGTHVAVPVIKRGAVDFAVGADWTPAAGDVKLSKDGGAAANITTLPTARAMGNTAAWEFQFSGAELSCKQLLVTVADAATKAVEDTAFIVATYGDANAMFQADLSAPALPANVTQTLGVAVTQGDFTLASATATTVTLPATYADGSALPDDDRYVDCALQVVAGTGAGQVILLTTGAAGARVYNVLAGTMPVQPDGTSVCAVLGPSPAALLKRSIAITAAVNRTVAEALAFVRNRWTSTGGILTVYDTDDATTLWTAALSGDATAQPVVGMDP